MTYLEKVLIPVLKPGQTVVLDNASFHKNPAIRDLIEKAGSNLIYLPPYSPDLNPIEHHWHSVKNTLRKHLQACNFDLMQAVEKTFDGEGQA